MTTGSANHPSSKRVGAIGVALAVVLGAPHASAFCRTTVCGGSTVGTLCTPSTPNDCGVPLAWKGGCTGYSLQQDASVQVTLDAATSIFDQAFSTWAGVDCGGGAKPNLSLHDLGPVACDKHEYNSEAPNANLVVFRDTGWPYAGAAGTDATIALTTVTYDLDNGEIYDADIELNSSERTFTTGDIAVDYDLLSIAQHETGHFLGLSHSLEQDATMFATYAEGDTSLRSLTADDIAAICASYPPASAKTCDPTPRHGFASECGSDEQASGSSCSAGALRTPTEGAWAMLGIAGVMSMTARRRARRTA